MIVVKIPRALSNPETFFGSTFESDYDDDDMLVLGMRLEALMEHLGLEFEDKPAEVVVKKRK